MDGATVIGIVVLLLVALGLGWYIWRRERPQPKLKQRQLTTNSSETQPNGRCHLPRWQIRCYTK